MEIYVVLIESGTDQARQAIEANWDEGRRRSVSDDIFMIAEQVGVPANTIADKIGIGVGEPVTGIVVQVKSWKGAVDNALVEWTTTMRNL